MVDKLQSLGFLKDLIQKREVLLRKKEFYNDKVIKERFLIMENKEKNRLANKRLVSYRKSLANINKELLELRREINAKKTRTFKIQDGEQYHGFIEKGADK
ncbi:hypothetical protein KVK77_05410 [Helicobacter pylori]|uniref:Uncharacterized protein n=1 Tax=Helicobacter pylori (strain SouthAfrica7) TaxID=907239 RepID=E8QUI8_HELPW|nr:hypothetical protein [Helicobacter pylori]ADU85470.1 hypothetical protein HPSA_07615 [Helicobacter pylori SouthAfrica7]WQV00917.1 hypothetical protein KVK53_07100 [Helicobacter pylori]WQV06400.1 hypothetical protein KVK77_05410 [Helicobacter pylori]